MSIVFLCIRYSSTPVCQVCICWQSRQLLDLCGTEDQDFGVRQCHDCRGPAGQYRPCYHPHAAASRAVCSIRAVTNVIAERDARASKPRKAGSFLLNRSISQSTTPPTNKSTLLSTMASEQTYIMIKCVVAAVLAWLFACMMGWVKAERAIFGPHC